MLHNLKSLILPLATCALFWGAGALNATDHESDSADENTENSLNLEDQAADQFLWNYNYNCAYYPNDPSCFYGYSYLPFAGYFGGNYWGWSGKSKHHGSRHHGGGRHHRRR